MKDGQSVGQFRLLSLDEDGQIQDLYQLTWKWSSLSGRVLFFSQFLTYPIPPSDITRRKGPRNQGSFRWMSHPKRLVDVPPLPLPSMTLTSYHFLIGWKARPVDQDERASTYHPFFQPAPKNRAKCVYSSTGPRLPKSGRRNSVWKTTPASKKVSSTVQQAHQPM